MKKITVLLALLLFSLCLLGSCKGKAEIISESAYIEIEVDNSEKTGELSFTEPLLVRSNEDIDALIDIINSAKKYEGDEFITFESCPIVSFYLKNGSCIYLCASDYKGIFYTCTRKDYSDKVLYRLSGDFKLASYIEAIYEDNK